MPYVEVAHVIVPTRISFLIFNVHGSPILCLNDSQRRPDKFSCLLIVRMYARLWRRRETRQPLVDKELSRMSHFHESKILKSDFYSPKSSKPPPSPVWSIESIIVAVGIFSLKPS